MTARHYDDHTYDRHDYAADAHDAHCPGDDPDCPWCEPAMCEWCGGEAVGAFPTDYPRPGSEEWFCGDCAAEWQQRHSGGHEPEPSPALGSLAVPDSSGARARGGCHE